MVARLALVRNHRVPVQCRITLAKRILSESLLWVDRHPAIVTVLWILLALGTVAGLVVGTVKVVQAV